MKVTIYTGKEFDSIDAAEKYLNEILNKALAKLYMMIKTNNTNLVSQENLLKRISDIHFINTDITKLKECKKWIQG